VQVKPDGRIGSTSLISGEVWRGGCEWYMVSEVVVLGEVGDGLFGIGH
jgi:hypothetical protein